ncbi:MORN repeat-containing protein [Mesorhizobium caraganae]|uniref:MORN repeat-containing protein n=1 Tax=Mesorhizobium caraganae TaxID=483206 RepID=UPI0033366AD2
MARAGMIFGVRAMAAASMLAALTCFSAMADQGGASPDGAWAERVQILYQSDTRSVLRKNVRVWDFHPELGLDFVWEPAAGQSPDRTVAVDGTVNGKGRLVWRVRGSASYDPKTIYSSYSGEIRNGRPDGQGRLELRSGEILDGHWVAGQLDGHGIHIDADGNRYEGQFTTGVPNGSGRLETKTGEIFAGSFADGLKNGKGRTRLPGGTVYWSQWAMGKEIGGARPDVLADARVGGLLKAQTGGGAADKVEIGIAVDQRMTQQADMQYQNLVRDEDIAIYPISDEYNDAWNGTGQVRTGNVYDGMDWEQAPAFAEVDLKTADQSRVKLDSLEMKVASSEAYRKPMLSISEHYGCVGFRPDFSIVNNGWGDVKDMKMSIQFTRTDEEDNVTGEPSRMFTKDIGNFGDGVDVSVKNVLSEAGVDTTTLETQRFTCPSRDALDVCRAQVANKVKFGDVADYISGSVEKMSVTGIGKLDYSWADDQGAVYQQSEPFRVVVSLVSIEVPESLAECGDGGGASPEALRYQNIEFPIGKTDYSIPMPVRGNKNLGAYTARLKMWSSMSSIHRFSIAAHFADGSTRESKPTTFFYFKPKQSLFETRTKPAVCYLPADLQGC